MRARKAFTLIELLVVIAIIALLLSIILPALKSAKIQSQAVVCLTNLASLTKAWVAYAAENDEKICSSDVPTPSANGYVLPQNLDWWALPPINDNWEYTGAPSGPGATLDERKLGIQRGVLFRYAGDAKAYHCPGDNSKLWVPNSLNAFANNYAYRTYSGVENLNGWKKGLKEQVFKINEIANSATKFVFVETIDMRGWCMGSWNMDFQPTAVWGDTIAVWHRDRSNIAFADGHADPRRWTDKSVLDAARNTNITWFKYGDINSEDFYFIKNGYFPGRIRR